MTDAKTRLHIVYVITGLDYAGAETQVRDLSLELRSRGHAVSVVSLTPPIAYADDLAAHGIACTSLGLERTKKSVSGALATIGKIGALIDSVAPDIVHSHMVHANLLTRLAFWRRPSPPLISTAHNTHEGGTARDWAYRLTNRFSTLNTTISAAATARFVGEGVFPPGKTITVHNGIRIEKFRPATNRSGATSGLFRWIAVGRLHEQKDYPTLLRALARTEGAHLDIVGRGELQASLQQLARDLKVEERVAFLGLRENVHELLPRYDGFVLSSAWEGFGLVVAEAMACGLPVVATRSGGPQEIVGEDEKAGFLVPPRAPEALAQAMARVADIPPAQRILMGQAGRKRIAYAFSMESIARRWEDIYRAVIKGRTEL